MAIACTCGQIHAHAEKRPVDPTRTVTIRRAYEGAMGKRFRWLKGEIWKAIVDGDALGLSGKALLAMPLVGLALGDSITPYGFPTNPAKVKDFMAWLGGKVDDGILEVTQRAGPTIVAHSEWQNVYVTSSYQKGLASSYPKLARAGYAIEGAQGIAGGVIGFNAPIHAESIGMLYIRNFEELRGVTEAMAQKISRTLAQGMAEGKGPVAIARSLVNEVDGITRTRARVLARTEIIRAHSEATLNSFESAGALGVTVMAEILTAGDACPICVGLEAETQAKPISIAEARGIVPVHPNCRCSWLPANVGEMRKAA